MSVTQLPASSLIVPGAYLKIQQPQNSAVPFVATGLNGFVFGANWGPINKPQQGSGPAQLYSTFGYSTTCPYSFQDVFNAMPEDGLWVGVRQTDGTDAAATIAMLGADTTDVIDLTAVYSGSAPDGDATLGIPAASARFDLVSSTTSGSNQYNPVYRLSITFPFQGTTEVYNNIKGYAGLNTSYDPATFKANVLAVVNGTAPNSVPSRNWVASAGSSTALPTVATPFAASGGADGTSGLTDAIMIGDDIPGNRTGLYALRGTKAFHVAVCGLTSLTYAQTISEYVNSEPGCALGFLTVPLGMSDQDAFQDRLDNSATVDNLVLVKDFLKIYDPIAKTTYLTDPIGKAMGIVGLLNPEVSPISQPWNTTGNTAGGVLATEQTLTGQPRSQDELAALCTNGFVSITNQTPINNGSFGFFNDVCASGDPRANSGTGNYIPVVRMTAYLAAALSQIGGPFVGKNQSIDKNDPTRLMISGAYNNFLSTLKPEGGVQRIDAYQVICDLTNNTPDTIAQGFCFVQVNVRYLGVIRILYVTLQGGTGVQVSQTIPPALLG